MEMQYILRMYSPLTYIVCVARALCSDSAANSGKFDNYIFDLESPVCCYNLYAQQFERKETEKTTAVAHVIPALIHYGTDYTYTIYTRFEDFSFSKLSGC